MMAKKQLQIYASCGAHSRRHSQSHQRGERSTELEDIQPCVCDECALSDIVGTLQGE